MSPNANSTYNSSENSLKGLLLYENSNSKIPRLSLADFKKNIQNKKE